LNQKIHFFAPFCRGLAFVPVLKI